MRVIEGYAGGGGAAKGLRDAGCEAVALIEWDPDACATLRAAGFANVIELDISSARSLLDGRDLICWWKYAGVDLAWFSPPCQPHSSQGSGGGLGDPREGTSTVVKAVKATSPRWVVVENVMPYATSAAAASLRQELLGMGYTISVHYLTASDLGVPQDRKRVFIIAGPVVVPPIEPHGLRVSMGEAIGRHLHDAESRKGNRARPNTEPCRTIGTKGNTMVWDDQQQKRRRLTVAESAIIQGFPAGWPFQGNKTSQYRQIGNAVPPKLAEVIARAVIAADKERA